MIAGQLERLLHAGGGYAGMAALGLPDALAAGLGWAETATLWRLLGAHASAAPLGEAMVARALLGEAGIAAPDGVVVLAEGGPAAPFGHEAEWVAVPTADGLALQRAGAAPVRDGGPGDPRGAVTSRPLPDCARRARLALALLRAAQMSGACAASLALAVDWANTRQQFGRPIGRFQAVQQLLAAMAGEAAALDAAVALAARAVDGRGLPGAWFEIAAAKVTAGEAATHVAAGAHQALAAMGMTEEFALGRLTRRLWAWREDAGNEREWAGELGRFAIEQGAGFWAALTERSDAAP